MNRRREEGMRGMQGGVEKGGGVFERTEPVQHLSACINLWTLEGGKRGCGVDWRKGDYCKSPRRGGGAKQKELLMHFFAMQVKLIPNQAAESRFTELH